MASLYLQTRSILNKWNACIVCVRCASNKPKDFSNFPEAYIKKEKEVIEWKNPKGRQYFPGKAVKNRVYNYTIHRPWETNAKMANPNNPRQKFPNYIVEPIRDQDWAFYRGDRVEILVGKDKGKQGIINYIVPERNWVIVEGLNCEYKYMGESDDYPGMMIKTELPLLVKREVTLVDPADMKATNVEWRWTEEGERVRVSTRTGRIIPVPLAAEETYDYKTKATYMEQPKDTLAKDLEEITYTPSLKTFEMEIMEEHGIKEDRIPFNTYWY